MRKTRSGAMTAAALAASMLASASAMAADLPGRSPPPPPPPMVYGPAPFFVNISGLFGSYNMSNTRTNLTSFGPTGGFGFQGARFNNGGFSGGVLATFQPLSLFGIGPWFNTITPIFQVGWFGDLNNISSTGIFGLTGAARGTGFAQTTTRSGVPIMGGISFPLSALPLPSFGGFFATTTIQLSAGVQITQRSASFGLVEIAPSTAGVNAAGVPFAAAGTTGFVAATQRYTSTDAAFSFGTMSQIPWDTPFGRPTLTSNMTFISSRSRNLAAPSPTAAGDVYFLRTRSGTELRATSGLGFSFGGPGAGLFR